MSDQSELDNKYFIDGDTYNCPFCNRHSVVYSIYDSFTFDWSQDKKTFGYIIQCHGCSYKSLHLSYFPMDQRKFVISFEIKDNDGKLMRIQPDEEKLDNYFFYHHPTSFFTLDHRIPNVIRVLVSEAEGCRKMNFLVGASGALRKAIYKFLSKQKASEEKDKKGAALSYEDQIKWVKGKYPKVPEELFDALSNIQGMTSEELHEDKDWEQWTQGEFDFLITAVKALLHEIYVVPEDRKKLLERVLALRPNKEVGGDVSSEINS